MSLNQSFISDFSEYSEHETYVSYEKWVFALNCNDNMTIPRGRISFETSILIYCT